MIDRLILSQSSLQSYVDCPRRFELRYLRELEWPALETREAIELEAGMLQGHEFHHLLYQHAMGIPVAALEMTIEDATIRRWWQNYLAWQTEHLPPQRFAETTVTTSITTGSSDIGPLLLTAKYDLLTRLPDGSLLIIDWKTGRPQRRAVLAGRLQTLVYRYALARAGDWLNEGHAVRPEQIRMIYWFADDGSTVEFGYSEDEHQRDEQRLMSIVGEIVGREEFPRTTDDRRCRFCCYRSLCDRGVEAPPIDEWLVAADEEMADPITIQLDDLEEISL
ncbi:MAG: PD-(D/E)XK nuclease family protein [Blastocatellia bacterium]|jgi:RecB family exonuclease